MGTSKKKKRSQEGCPEALRQIQPNGSPGGTGGASSGGPPRFDGRPEHVPEITFIVERRTATDDFINGANTYHTNCGLQPQTIRSLEHLVTILNGSTDHIGRMRIVTHAAPDNMAVAMFDGSTYFHADEPFLRGFAESDIAGLYSLMGLPTGRHFLSWDIFTITLHIRATNRTLLEPFDLDASGTPADALRDFILFCSDRFLVNTNHIRENNSALAPGHKNILLATMNVIIQQTGQRLVGTVVERRLRRPRDTHVITQAEMDLLRDFIFGMTLNDFGLTSATFNFSIPPGVQTFPLLDRAVVAITNNFRNKLNRVKQRFNENSTIDIRGCRAGERASYLEAVQLYFGTTNHLPHVTGPRWYQYFGPSAFSHPNSNATIRSLLQTGADAAINQQGFEDWSRRSGVDPSHKTFWTDLLADTPTGIVLQFCLMQWRNRFPLLPLQTPGLTTFVALNFRDAIIRMAEFFNVTTDVPSGTALTNLNNFVTGQLTTWVPNLTATVETSTPLETLRNLYTALRQINRDLGQSIVPATEPSRLRANNITSYQTDLIHFIEEHQLLPARAFMTAIRQRIQSTADPGINYYMLHIGMPVFVFSHVEQVNNHAVRVTHNRLVVHQSFADAAYRQWPPLLWVEPLPPANRFATLTPGTDDARRFAMMVELATGGNSEVAACPHPDYMDKIRST